MKIKFDESIKEEEQNCVSGEIEEFADKFKQ